MRIGSEAHKQLFCGAFLATHRVYEPEQLPWPEMDAPTLDRLRRLPFWDEAITTEKETAAKIEAYASTVADPTLRRAIAVQAVEEARHARLLEVLMARYGIEGNGRPVSPSSDDLEQAFVDAGYGECVDSFFAFGLFEIARRTQLFPEALLGVVDPIVGEEARHIVFFVNWEAYQQARRWRGVGVVRPLRALWYYLRAVRRRLGALRSARGEGFTASGAGAVAIGVRPDEFLSTCLRENKRRLAGFDTRLLRPRLVPALAQAMVWTFSASRGRG